MKNFLWQQNRHQKVFYMGALQYICAVGLDILKFEQTLLFYSASYFNLGGGIGALFQRGYANQRPPVVTGLCGKTSACFLMQLTWKVLRLCNMSSLHEKICQAFCFTHDRDESDATHSSVYSASRQNLCWDYFAFI